MIKKIAYYHQAETGLELIYSQNNRISYPLHNHVSTYVIGFVLKGKFILRREKEPICYSPNTLFIISPYEPHALSVITPYDLLNICIPRSVIETAKPATLKQQTIQSLLQILPESTLDADKADLLQNAIDALYWQHQKNQHQTENPHIASLKSALEKEAEKNIRIQTMAKSAFSSPYHFIRKFRKSVGLPPHQFQIQNRVRKAQKLLPTTPSLTDVALMSGFYDQSHLIRQFKKILGITPGEYRQSFHELPQ